MNSGFIESFAELTNLLRVWQVFAAVSRRAINLGRSIVMAHKHLPIVLLFWAPAYWPWRMLNSERARYALVAGRCMACPGGNHGLANTWHVPW